MHSPGLQIRMEGQGQNHENAHLRAISNLHAKFQKWKKSKWFYTFPCLQGIYNGQTDKVITLGHYIILMRGLKKLKALIVATKHNFE